MIVIRDKFVDKVRAIASDSVGSFVVLQMGVKQHQQHAALHPNATIQVGAGAPDTPRVRAVKYAPTHGQIQTSLSNNRNLILELHVAKLVQAWFDFLSDVYEKAIDDNLNHSQGYSIPASKFKVDLSLSGSQFKQQIDELGVALATLGSSEETVNLEGSQVSTSDGQNLGEVAGLYGEPGESDFSLVVKQNGFNSASYTVGLPVRRTTMVSNGQLRTWVSSSEILSHYDQNPIERLEIKPVPEWTEDQLSKQELILLRESMRSISKEEFEQLLAR
jgi:hypothetical protein